MQMGQYTELSKLLSLVLRHKPEKVGVTLDAGGWTDVSILITKLQAAGVAIDSALLQQVVATNNKQRFSFNADGTKIRASQGHSVAVQLSYPPVQPPLVLYHGTAVQNISSIQQQGLQKGKRNHVHLSENKETAMQVGRRHGKPVVFEVAAAHMFADKFIFYLSDNGVWLTDNAPPHYLSISNNA